MCGVDGTRGTVKPELEANGSILAGKISSINPERLVA